MERALTLFLPCFRSHFLLSSLSLNLLVKECFSLSLSLSLSILDPLLSYSNHHFLIVSCLSSVGRSLFCRKQQKCDWTLTSFFRLCSFTWWPDAFFRSRASVSLTLFRYHSLHPTLSLSILCVYLWSSSAWWFLFQPRLQLERERERVWDWKRERGPFLWSAALCVQQLEGSRLKEWEVKDEVIH